MRANEDLTARHKRRLCDLSSSIEWKLNEVRIFLDNLSGSQKRTIPAQKARIDEGFKSRRQGRAKQ